MIYAFLNNPKMNFNAFIHLFFILLKFSYSTSSDECTKSTPMWYSLKYPYLNLLENYKLQNTAFNCPILQTRNCCNSVILKEMSSVSEIKLKGFAEEKLENLLTMFSNDSYILMNMYLNDLENTKNDLNQLFSATYGYNYKVEKNFFFSWFDKLKMYMEGKKHNIGQLLDEFFLEMAGKIVKILIPPESSPEVTKCQIDRLIEAKPYQEADNSLKKNIIRSYAPSRMFVNAIAVGRDGFRALMNKITPSSNCVAQFNTQFHCMLCNGLTVKTCPVSCKSVMENCFGSFKLAELKKLDKIFTKYLSALFELANKLDNQLNFPAVNHKMNVQISTAIMNIQNIYPTIKEQIKAKCQNTGSKVRRKRQVAKEFVAWQTKLGDESPFWEKKLNDNLKSGVSKKTPVGSQNTKLNDFLSPMSRRIKTKYKALEGYFLRGVHDFCTLNSQSNESSSTQCWNGTLPGIVTDKNNKKKLDKSSVSVFKTVTNNLKDITMKINDLLRDKVPDPETVAVEDYLLYKSKPSSKRTGKPIKPTLAPSIEGSGDFENFPISPGEQTKKIEPEEVKPTLPPPNAGKPILEEDNNQNNKIPEQPKISHNPSWEGSGDTSENKPDTKPFNQLPVNTPEKKSSILVPRNTSTPSLVKVVIQSSTESNINTDDEDMVSRLPNIVPEKPIITSSSKPNIIPEGSGSDPDFAANKPQIPAVESITTITTTASLPDKPVEGSGSEVDPPQEVPRPVLPMIPEIQGSTIKPPSSRDSKFNPDEEKSIEGSGRAGGGGGGGGGEGGEGGAAIQRISPKPETITDYHHRQSTLSPTKSLQPDQYPGTIPSEVWIPGIVDVKNSNKDKDDTQKPLTTPGGNAISSHKSTLATITVTTLSLLFVLLLNCLK